MNINIRKEDALYYHEYPRPGKLEVVPLKTAKSQRDLAMAYTPGVAFPCIEIAQNTENAFRYTAKSNLVGVITNGTAVLGLGDIGPLAAKPVMEGKAVLFKIFADIDVFDLELDASDPELFIQVVKTLEPTFGGINLEDIKAPDAFEIEQRLKSELNIPVMHDDQHGTAIIAGAAFLNALKLAGKDIDKVQIVIVGAGAAGLSVAKLLLELGVTKDHILMYDKDGLLTKDRPKLDRHKLLFATDRTDVHSLEEGLDGADVFIGLSTGGVLKPAMLKRMAKNPIVFALANPVPEIDYDTAIATRDDVIMATGRSDYPNQVNNVLGFPFIFRGALDVQATEINEEMKLAAVYALADLALQPVPEIVNIAYHTRNLKFGKDYFIPKPLDPRLITTVSPAVARAAIESGVARKIITDWEAYKDQLRERLGIEDHTIRLVMHKAKRKPMKVVFAEAENYKILKAAEIVKDDGTAFPILLGDKERIRKIIDEYRLDLDGVPVIDTFSEETAEKRQKFGDIFFEKRKRKGYNFYEAHKIMRERNYFGAMMVDQGEADAMVSGLTRKYASTIRPALEVVGTEPGFTKVAGMYMLLTKRGPMFFSDTTVNINPDVDTLIQITLLTARAVRQLNITPRIALLSYSNFGSHKGEEPQRMKQVFDYLSQNHPELIVEGEIQANFALNSQLLKENYPFSVLVNSPANTFIFPNLSAGNIAYKLMQELGHAEAIGPILLGLKKPVHILQLGSSVREIVHMVTIAVVDAQAKSALA